jgi:beta-galactosidase
VQPSRPGPLGTAINLRALERQIELLKEMGANAIRTSHNPPAPELLELCDRMGMVVMVEAFDCWKAGKRRNDYQKLFVDWHEKDLRAMVRRDRNHPSVILWSTGNEIREQGNAEGHKISAALAQIARDEDPTRPITAGCNAVNAGYNGFQKTVDVFRLQLQASRVQKIPRAKSRHPALRQRDFIVREFARGIFLSSQRKQSARPRRFPSQFLRPVRPAVGLSARCRIQRD